MAHQEAGNAEQAQEHLNRANVWTDGALADEKQPPRWERRATFELLREEAESLLGNDDAKAAESDQEPERKEK
jgi:hypothetical protein